MNHSVHYQRVNWFGFWDNSNKLKVHYVLGADKLCNSQHNTDSNIIFNVRNRHMRETTLSLYTFI